MVLFDKHIIHGKSFEELDCIIGLPLCFFLRKILFSILTHFLLEILFLISVYCQCWVLPFCILISNKAVMHMRTDGEFQWLKARKQSESQWGRAWKHWQELGSSAPARSVFTADSVFSLPSQRIDRVELITPLCRERNASLLTCFITCLTTFP